MCRVYEEKYEKKARNAFNIFGRGRGSTKKMDSSQVEERMRLRQTQIFGEQDEIQKLILNLIDKLKIHIQDEVKPDSREEGIIVWKLATAIYFA